MTTRADFLEHAARCLKIARHIRRRQGDAWLVAHYLNEVALYRVLASGLH